MHDNLKRYGIDKEPLSREEAEKIGRKGGIASGEKRTFKSEAQKILNMAIKLDKTTAKDVKAVSDQLGFKLLTMRQAALLALAVRAIKGDARAFVALRDTAGEKPIDVVEMIDSDLNIHIDYGE